MPFSGNKARKLSGLLLSDSQPQLITSHGGAQSNAMLSIATACHLLERPFSYFTRAIPEPLRRNPHGNLKEALDLNMQLHVCPSSHEAQRAASAYGKSSVL